ncbi:hypothetical protein [Desulfosporosinus fructosivorans]|nr:hypothetical protein [Desulfosporosinus fructosivorans]
MSLRNEYSHKPLIELKERENREHIFDMLGTISAAIIVIVFVIAKLQN